MRYAGAKGGYVKGIIRVIRGFLRPDTVYWEPMVGSGKVIAAVRCKVRYGTDLDPHIIGMLKAVRDGWVPPKVITEEEYKEWRQFAKDNPDSENPMIGFAGYGCSFGGKFFGGFIHEGYSHCVAGEQMRTLLKQAPHLKGIRFEVRDYTKGLNNPGWDRFYNPTLIYCDPPYKGTIRVGSRKGVFDTDKFWEWAEEWSKRAVVLVSEYDCPVEGASVVWERTKAKMLRSKDGAAKTEKLFCLRAGVASKVGLGIG